MIRAVLVETHGEIYCETLIEAETVVGLRLAASLKLERFCQRTGAVARNVPEEIWMAVVIAESAEELNLRLAETETSTLDLVGR